MLFKEASKEALHVTEDVAKISRADMEALKQRALVNERKRIRVCCHKDISDPLHEMLIIHTKGAYVKPHKHLNKSESLHIMEGRVDAVLLDEQGHVTEVIPMGEYSSGLKFYYRMAVPCFHTFIIHSDFLVFHEITKGPFQKSDTVFAPWAPEESDQEACQAYMQKLMQHIRRTA